MLAGSIWGFVGLFLIYRGWMMYQLAAETQNATQKAILVSLAAALVIGAIKGKFVLSKTARRNKNRIQNLSEPLKFHHVYAKSFYIFIIGMMVLGVLLRTWNEALGGYLVVAAIYCGIGIALIISSLVYWKPEPTIEKST